jgi:hypothetical protein
MALSAGSAWIAWRRMPGEPMSLFDPLPQWLPGRFLPARNPRHRLAAD